MGQRARFVITHPKADDLDAVPRLLAGACDVDITPPPGMPKAGYSSNANNGDGFRTRLKARVVHLRQGRVSMAIVQCDLLGGSSVLQHLIAEQIRDRTDIPLAGLLVGATHTHAGPGQFLGTDFYNRFASNRSGFDPAWTAFLLERIANGIVEAHDARVPAVAAVGSIDVWGLTRNRSMPPFVNNETVTDKRLEPQRKYASVNPNLHMIRIDADRGDHTVPLAAPMVFSVHGTGVSMKSHEYNADVWAYIVGETRMRIFETTGVSPVVSAMEGTHADIAPAIRPKLAGHLESARVGQAIGALAAELHQSLAEGLRSDLALGAAFREVDLDESRRIGDVELPHRPAVGAALVAGATENVTPVIHKIPPFKAGSAKRSRPHRHHGEKWILGSELGQAALLPLRSFPRVIPMQLLRIGSATIAALPFEITNEAGRRIAESVAGALEPAVVDRPTTDDAAHDRPATGEAQADGKVIVSSVANEYFGYVTTPDEYAVQFYEGGHTLYGPKTLDFLCGHMADLAGSSMADSVLDQSQLDRRFDLAVRQFWPESEGGSAERRVLSPPRFVDATAIEEPYWELLWADAAPGELDWSARIVSIEALDPTDGAEWEPAMRRGAPVDDNTWWVHVSHLGAQRDGTHRYRARWYQPDLVAGRLHRFVLEGNNGQPRIESTPFD